MMPDIFKVLADGHHARAALLSSGALPENVNYAVKSSFLLSFLESVPEISAKLKEPNTKERKFDDMVNDAENARWWWWFIDDAALIPWLKPEVESQVRRYNSATG